MRFDELVQAYFERSNALQWYWTLYVVVIGGLLAFSSAPKERDRITAAVVTLLFICFAYKNLGAIGDATAQRQAILTGMKLSAPPNNQDNRPEDIQSWEALEPTLNPPAYEGVRNFHVACDVLTVAAVWAMERRRWRRRRGEGWPLG
jgi:hypothetical protein